MRRIVGGECFAGEALTNNIIFVSIEWKKKMACLHGCLFYVKKIMS